MKSTLMRRPRPSIKTCITKDGAAPVEGMPITVEAFFKPSVG